jgi:anti-sigma-K factor RskA
MDTSRPSSIEELHRDMNEASEMSPYQALAAEYVLGTLQGRDREEFEREMARDYRLRSEVEAWENRLNPMLETIDPVAPPREIWRSIERTLERRQRAPLFALWQSLNLWRGLAAAALATLLVLTLQLFTQAQRTFDRMLVVTDTRSQPAWVVSSYADEPMLKVAAIQTPELPDGRYCQLWMEDASGRLVPVGVLPHNGSLEVAPPSAILQHTLFKVSVELKQEIAPRAPSPQIIFEGKMVDL